jgi:hypothetical protein
LIHAVVSLSDITHDETAKRFDWLAEQVEECTRGPETRRERLARGTAS